MKQVELRSYGLKEFRAIENENEKIIEGHAVVFDQQTNMSDCFYEVIDRGAFDGCDMSDVALFVNHDSRNLPLAHTKSGTLELNIDDIGLSIRARLDVENNSDAKALYSAVARGDIRGMSCAIVVDAEEWQDLESKSSMPLRRIKKFKAIYDVSVVNYPAYEGTDVVARAKVTLQEAKKEKEKMNEKDERSYINPPKFIQGEGFIPAGESSDRTISTALELREKAGKELKENKTVKSPLSVFGELRSVTVTPASGQTATIVVPNYVSAEIKPGFSVVSSLVDAVGRLTLSGGDSFSQPYITDIDAGDYTLEGANAAEAETHFDYAKILRTKITAYAEISKELEKLPSAPYADTVFQNIRTSMRKLLAKEILIGAGNDNQITGIFSEKATAIDPDTDISISEITDTTLDEIVYKFGGEEDVESFAVLLLNKADLLLFSKVRTSTKQKFYDIQLNSSGNGGTISGVPFIINSACKSLMGTNTQAGDYCMAYGYLDGYTLVEFSEMTVERSDDFKFRQGMRAFLGESYFGGNVTRKNSFLRVKKASS